MASAFGTGSAALLKAISSPLSGWNRQQKSRPPNTDPVSDDNVGSVIEGDFIPRLLLQQTGDPPRTEYYGDGCVEVAEADRFAPLALELEASELLAEVEAFLDRGVRAETIFVDLLAPSARYLGRMWEEDRCDFVDVTMGLWRLQEVMREVASRSPTVTSSFKSPRTALFSPIPGDQHSFGALIIDEVFARGGWDSEALIEPDRRALLKVVGEKWFDVIGLTISNDCTSGAIAQLISAIRSVSANPNPLVLIGGRVVNENPDLVEQTGADGTATDAEAALDLAGRLVGELGLRVQHAS